MWFVTDVEKDLSLHMSDTVEKIKQLMLDQRTARTCKSLTELSDTVIVCMLLTLYSLEMLYALAPVPALCGLFSTWVCSRSPWSLGF